MKYARTFLTAYLLLPITLLSQTGTDCANAIPLLLDGVCRTYATSSSTGAAVICTKYPGNSPVTYFSFTTNNKPDKVLIDITSPTEEPCEVLLYTSGCGTMYSSGVMCFNDGKGLWSFSQNFSVQPNTTYKLRIKTTQAGSITLCAKNYTPPNNDCKGALSIGTTPIADNNACHIPATEINPASLLCAYTLENTAFYQFYVAKDGYCVVNISDINCDNRNSNNSNGFQIGFFKGSCSSLEHLGCDSNSNTGSNSFLQFTTPALTAGTRITIAVDGNQGSNCSYKISGINIMGVLSAGLEDFTVWKTEHSNLLKWSLNTETAGQYLIERSQNGRDFYSIGRVNIKAPGSQRASYSFEDHQPTKRLFYRLKQVGYDGSISVSRIIRIDRDDMPQTSVSIVNPVLNNKLEVLIRTESSAQFQYVITSASGQVFLKGVINCPDGATRFVKDISVLPAGKYFASFNNREIPYSLSFIKLNNR